MTHQQPVEYARGFLKVDYINHTITENEINEAFAKFGVLIFVTIISNTNENVSAYVHYETEESG